jgi:hypothetical protein
MKGRSSAYIEGMPTRTSQQGGPHRRKTVQPQTQRSERPNSQMDADADGYRRSSPLRRVERDDDRASTAGSTPSWLSAISMIDERLRYGRLIAAWRADYIGCRPHTSLGGLTPSEFAARSDKGHNHPGFSL